MQGVYEIMERCWLMEPRERPTFTVLEQLLAKNFGEWRERRGNREREGSRGVGERKKGARKRGERRERNDKLERGKERGRKKERWGK